MAKRKSRKSAKKDDQRAAQPAPPPETEIERPSDDPPSVPYLQPPRLRRLRVYAFDPSLTTLETAVINHATLSIPWEQSLRPGPVGEYLEVVDLDPSSGCLYEPIDLSHPYALAQDGMPPSEGSPQFHQQMVYAVAMRTIQTFESALGRVAQWSPRSYEEVDKDEDRFVPRLRIYPHALREANAFYSPSKKALLFGYFRAQHNIGTEVFPGGMIFTCLSHDIIAHETTHALLDGMHQRFIEPSNPDVLAFHEAFADIVAIFQHFSMPEVLRHQIAKTRGDLGKQNRLAELAQQFGKAAGYQGALRNAIGGKPDPAAYEATKEPHARGAILVATVFDAFLAIYKTRVDRLMRLASGGTGVLTPGELHPDLVDVLAEEASKAASHVLRICIRALDYCPPVDITFGDYLRAIITADTDLVLEDKLGYRLAFLEAFRRRGIYPENVRTLSAESLRWPRFSTSTSLAPGVSADLVRELVGDAQEWRVSGSRRDVFLRMRKWRAELHGRIRNLKKKNVFPALNPDLPVEVHSLRPTQRVSPDGQADLQWIVEITQKEDAVVDGQSFKFRGGYTLIVDGKDGSIGYAIDKPIFGPGGDGRRKKQAQYIRESTGRSLAAAYAPRPADEGEALAALHRPL